MCVYIYIYIIDLFSYLFSYMYIYIYIYMSSGQHAEARADLEEVNRASLHARSCVGGRGFGKLVDWRCCAVGPRGHRGIGSGMRRVAKDHMGLKATRGSRTFSGRKKWAFSSFRTMCNTSVRWRIPVGTGATRVSGKLLISFYH